MKTIIHLVLSDEERNDLAKRIDREDTKRLVTRKEVLEHVFNFIAQEIIDGRDDDYDQSEPEHAATDNTTRPATERSDSDGPKHVPAFVPSRGDEERHTEPVPKFDPSRGDEPYLACPKDTELAAACTRVLDDCALIQARVWDAVEHNRRQT